MKRSWASRGISTRSTLTNLLFVLLVAGLSVSSDGASDSATILLGFPGVTGDQDSLVPDPAIAVGPDRLVLITNGGLVLADKSGNILTTNGLHSFFLPAIAEGESSAGDVAALYDVYSARFFLAQAAKIHPQTCAPGTCVGHNLVAVSKSSTPSSLDGASWFFYAFDRYQERTSAGIAFTTNWGDFDHLGANSQALFITSKRYRESDGAQMGPKIRILNKAKLISGEQPTTWVDIVSSDSEHFAGIQPATMFGPAPAFFLVSRLTCGLRIWGITDGLTTPSVVTRSVALAGDCAAPPDPAQPSAAPRLAVPLVGLATTPVFRRGVLWFADTWRQSTGSGDIAAVKWAAVDVSRWPSTVTVLQEGTVDAGGAHSFFPALTVDGRGAMTLAFITSSVSEFPSLKVTGRLADDPVGVLRSLVTVKAGTAVSVHMDNANRNRFADYTTMAFDPSASTSWVHGQYGTAGNWQTWVAEARVGNDARSFTDPHLIPRLTTPNVAHIVDLRTRIDGVRIAKGLSGFPWTDALLTPEATTINALHILDLRTALAEAYAVANRDLPAYNAPSLARGSAIRSIDIEELRAAVVDIE